MKMAFSRLYFRFPPFLSPCLKVGGAAIVNGLRQSKAARQAFTVPEIMISVSLFLLVIIGFVSANLFGSRLLQVSQIRLASTDDIPRLNRWLLNDLRSGKLVCVGQGGSNSFQEAASNTLQQGNAVQIYPSTNTAAFIRYYLDTNDCQLKRLGDDQSLTVLTGTITNTVVFTAQTATGVILSNKQSSVVIGVQLVYSSLTNSGIQLGSGNYYNNYALQFKVASRTLE